VITFPAGVRGSGSDEAGRLPARRGQPTALAKEELQRDPFSGTIFVFRSKRADRLKILAWDGSGLILYWKRSSKARFAGRRSATA
jgi:transposase